MIRTGHNWFIYNFFKLYTIFQVRRNFHKVQITGEPVERNLPVLVICNHVSWWDGFWVMYVNMRLFHRLFFFMMLEEKLDEFSFFKKCGGYPVRKGSRSILESLQYTVELLRDRNNLVLMFPQGEISSMHNQHFKFGHGIERIVSQVTGNIQVIFMANLVDYFSEKKPSLFIYLKEYHGNAEDAGKIEEHYNIFYSECVSGNIYKSL